MCSEPWIVRSLLLVFAISTPSCSTSQSNAQRVSHAPDPSASVRYHAPGEFEPQEYIWMTWSENSWLGGPPMSDTILELVRALTPYVRVRLLYSEWTSWLEQATNSHTPRTLEQARDRLLAKLRAAGIDLERVSLLASPQLFGALQDPGPFFLRDQQDALAVADFRTPHPFPETEALDRTLAARIGLPTVSSSLVSDGGNRQSNGRGTLLIGAKYEQSINPSLTREEMARQHLRVHGARKLIWLESGPADEEFGRLADGRWGIGTGGHIDEFARFADERTVLLLEVAEVDRARDPARDPMLAETHRRMEENYAILAAATDQDGRPLRILRMPAAEIMTATVRFDDLDRFERSWFEGAASGDTIEFYLPGSYLNFVLANGVVVAPRFFREGQPDSVRRRDEAARAALQAAFPDRTIVQIDVLPQLYDGGGLHCSTRNQPASRPRRR